MLFTTNIDMIHVISVLSDLLVRVNIIVFARAEYEEG